MKCIFCSCEEFEDVSDELYDKYEKRLTCLNCLAEVGLTAGYETVWEVGGNTKTESRCHFCGCEKGACDSEICGCTGCCFSDCSQCEERC